MVLRTYHTRTRLILKENNIKRISYYKAVRFNLNKKVLKHFHMQALTSSFAHAESGSRRIS